LGVSDWGLEVCGVCMQHLLPKRVLVESIILSREPVGVAGGRGGGGEGWGGRRGGRKRKGLGLGVGGLGLGVWGLGFGVWGLGFGVWGLGFGGLPSLPSKSSRF